jgi:hypothetical protein
MTDNPKYALLRTSFDPLDDWKINIGEITGQHSNGLYKIKYEAPFYEFRPIKVFSEEEGNKLIIKIEEARLEMAKSTHAAREKYRQFILSLFPELSDKKI